MFGIFHLFNLSAHTFTYKKRKQYDKKHAKRVENNDHDLSNRKKKPTVIQRNQSL